jgi:HNH endonuclease
MTQKDQTNTFNKFCERSKKKYDDIFDFTDTVYTNYKTKMEIKCKKHDEIITITPSRHMSHKFGGCIKCKNSRNIIVLEEGEVIKDVNIDACKGFYMITNFGRIFNKITNKELHSHVNNCYKMFQLKNYKHVSIHKIVYLTFGGEIEKGKVIDHIDGDKLNNRIDNLQCVSISENCINSFKNNPNMRKDRIVQAFNEEGEFIKEFKNLNDAKDFINHKAKTSINSCITGQKKMAGGFVWKLKNEEIKNIKDKSNYICIGKIGNEDYSNYFINSQGSIINKNSIEMKCVCLEGTYIHTSLSPLSKKRKTFKIHRLVGKYFLPDGDKYFFDENYVINHKDENKHNNVVENLEWITKKQNSTYSSGKKIVRIDIKTQERKEYNSVSDALRDIGKNPRKTGAHIISVCNDKGFTCYGYKWEYV